MQASQVALFLLVSLLGVKLNQAGPLSSPVKYYDKIDDYLTTAVSTDDVEENMAKAAEWLAELETKGCIAPSGNSLVKALKNLLQLQLLVGQDKCNIEGYDILTKNDVKAGYPLRDKSKANSYRRIDLIVKHYAEKHFEACKSVWPEKVADKIKDVSPESMKYVMEFVSDSSSPWDYRYRGQAYIKLLRSYTDADPIRKEAAEKKEFYYQKHLVTLDDYKKYMVDPCKEVSQKVNEDLYKSIKFGIFVRGPKSKLWGDEQAEFREHRSIMEWCNYIVYNEKPIWECIYEVMKDEKDGEKRRKDEDKKRNDKPINWKRLLLGKHPSPYSTYTI